MKTANANERISDRLLVDVVSAAKLLGISTRLTQNLIYSGELPSLHIGRLRRIEVSALEAYVERMRTEQQ